ncbi:MAG: 50S ribosomal protein L11 methyltransferase [Alphaproteobacteria bacterium]|nr:MAG: 50S ribosomal protein L11 methyltransferase [Alphaproteobacteria bacterium]
MSRPPEPDLWQLSVTLPLAETLLISDLFEEEALTVSTVEAVEDGSLWRLDFLFDGKPDEEMMARLPADLDFDLGPLPQKDWVSESQKHLPPVDAGRFYIHGSHDAPHPANSRHDLMIEAGRAFGTGLHETTFGCLLALDDLHKRKRLFNPLDLGCGSGVLALAIAKAWGIPVLASDIDPDAVEVTRENAKTNRLAPLITAVEAVGLQSRVLRSKAPYDLIVANILAWPLVKMAPEIAAALARDGELILSGLLQKQEVMVRNAYREQGLFLKRRYMIGVWEALVLARH